MNLIEIVRQLEGKTDEERREIICLRLDELGIKYERQSYHNQKKKGSLFSGQNLIAEVGEGMKIVGVASHYDAVEVSPGANDNASAVAVTLDVLRRVKESSFKNLGVRGFFFDDEEEELAGSQAYIKMKKHPELIGVYNMEMVGAGNKIALWGDGQINEGRLLRALEFVARSKNILTYRFPHIRKLLGNSGDHQSFVCVGMESFCITTVSDEDLRFAYRYLSSPNPNFSLIREIAYKELPLFRNYHQPTDRSEHLNEQTMAIVSDLLFSSLRRINE